MAAPQKCLTLKPESNLSTAMMEKIFNTSPAKVMEAAFTPIPNWPNNQTVAPLMIAINTPTITAEL